MITLVLVSHYNKHLILEKFTDIERLLMVLENNSNLMI